MYESHRKRNFLSVIFGVIVATEKGLLVFSVNPDIYIAFWVHVNEQTSE